MKYEEEELKGKEATLENQGYIPCFTYEVKYITAMNRKSYLDYYQNS